MNHESYRHHWLRFLARVHRTSPVKLVLLGYLSYALVGWALLCLPFCQDEPVSALDNLFIASSAMSTTGLATLNVPVTYTFWGELVIVSLIQLGGIGYMTLGSFVVLTGTRTLSRFREDMTRTAFALPDDFKPTKFVRNVILFTLSVEAVGAVLLYFAFSAAGVADRGAGDSIGASFQGQALIVWQSIFHSISAFCTAGFSLFPDSLESYRANAWINLIISALSLLGALGFIVMSDLAASLAGSKHKITLTTRIILQFTFCVILGGATILFFAEPTIVSLPNEERLMAAWFQSMTAMTTVGFNTLPFGVMAAGPMLMVIVLMVIGASPSGTGGGLKSTSVSAVWATMRSALRGQETITFNGKAIPSQRLHAAYASLGFYILTLFVGSLLLLLSEAPPASVAKIVEEELTSAWVFEDYLFESASALGTVGISRGVTGDLSSLGKLIIISLMLIGRIGPLTFSLAILGRDEPDSSTPTTLSDLAI